jgi:hypothetical protein
MVTELQHAPTSEPFRWKLFLLVVLIMGTITAAAITLSLMARPSGGSLHVPTTQPIVQVTSPAIRPPGNIFAVRS